MRMSITLLALLISSALARAEPGPAEAALDLKLFLEMQAQVPYRVLDFKIIAEQKLNEQRKHVRYEARIEFPTGLSPEARHTLKNSEVKWLVGALEELSSKPVLVELNREARFRKSFSRWSTLIGSTYVLVK
jgi:hypothetical protein